MEKNTASDLWNQPMTICLKLETQSERILRFASHFYMRRRTTHEKKLK